METYPTSVKRFATFGGRALDWIQVTIDYEYLREKSGQANRSQLSDIILEAEDAVEDALDRSKRIWLPLSDDPSTPSPMLVKSRYVTVAFLVT